MRPQPHSPSAAPARAWFNIAAKGLGAAISFLLYVVLARTMTPEGFADVAVVFAWLAIGASVACLNSPMVLIKHVPESLAHGRPDLAHGVVRATFAVTGLLAVAVALAVAAAILAGGLSLPRDLGASALLACALMVPSVLLLGFSGLLGGLKRAAVAEVMVSIARPALAVAGLAALWIARPPPTAAPTVLAFYLGASVVMVAVAGFYAARVAPLEMARARPAYAIGEWARSSAAFMGVAIAAALHERIDLLLLAVSAPAEEVAAYSVAARLVQTVVMATSAASAVMAPHFVERLADLRRGHRAEAQAIVRSAALISLAVSLAALVVFAVAGPLILSLFGTHYRSAYGPLMVLAAGQALASLGGPGTAVAAVSGEARIALGALGAGIAANAALNVALVPAWGGYGAAAGTATGMIVAAALARAWTRRRLGLDPSVFARARRAT